MYEKKVKNTNLNLFVIIDGKNDYEHVLYPLLYLCGQKEKKHKATLLMGGQKAC
jgi:hypothetical protein